MVAGQSLTGQQQRLPFPVASFCCMCCCHKQRMVLNPHLQYPSRKQTQRRASVLHCTTCVKTAISPYCDYVFGEWNCLPCLQGYLATYSITIIGSWIAPFWTKEHPSWQARSTIGIWLWIYVSYHTWRDREIAGLVKIGMGFLMYSQDTNVEVATCRIDLLSSTCDTYFDPMTILCFSCM